MCIKIRISMLTYTHVHPNTQINTQIPSRTVTTRARSDSLSQNLLLKRLHTYRDKLPRLRGGGNELHALLDLCSRRRGRACTRPRR